MSAVRLLVVNADDFGRSRGVNEGVLEAHDRGIVTSASLMVRGAAAAAAAAAALERPRLSLGLHLELGGADSRAVLEDVERQLEVFRRLAGGDPTHLDSHKHVHLHGPAREAAQALAAQLRVPLRHLSPVRHCGAFFARDDAGAPRPEAITVESLVALLHRLPPGATELSCHPARAVEYPTSYGAERLTELATLCDPRVRAALESEGIELRSFRGLAAATGRDGTATK